MIKQVAQAHGAWHPQGLTCKLSKALTCVCSAMLYSTYAKVAPCISFCSLKLAPSSLTLSLYSSISLVLQSFSISFKPALQICMKMNHERVDIIYFSKPKHNSIHQREQQQVIRGHMVNMAAPRWWLDMKWPTLFSFSCKPSGICSSCSS